MQMAELGKKIDEQELTALTQDLEQNLAKNRNIKSYSRLKSNQQALADLFSDDTYASHNTKAGLQKTKAALQKEISEREAKGGKMPEYVNAMKRDLETIEFRLAHLEKLNDVTTFEVSNNGDVLVDDIFLKESNDISRTGIEVKQEGITLGGKEVKVIGVNKNKTGELLCNVDGQDFVISHEGDKIVVKPSTILLKGSLELSLLGVYGKEESGKITKRVGQDKKVTISASAADKKTFKEQEDAATLKAITDIDSVQDISGKTIEAFLHNQPMMFDCIDAVFTNHDATKTYWKYLDASQKKLFVDDVLRSHTSFAGGNLLHSTDAKKAFFDAILAYKYATTTSKTTEEVQDAFIGFHKNQELQKIVSDAFQNALQKNITSATDDVVKNNLAQFYKKYSTKQVSEFDLFYNKLENDQTGAFAQIKQAFESVKQTTMFDAFKDAMGANSHVKAEKINNEGVWENIPGDQQARFCMQMVFQDEANAVYAPWDRIQYIPSLHHKNILGLESFLETFKDEISALAKKETDPAKLRGTIKTLILEKLGNSEVKNILKNKLLATFGDKISQNIAGGSTNVLNEMNKFAIDAKAFQPGYKKYIEQNQNTPVNNNNPVHNTIPAPAQIDVQDDFNINEFEDGQDMTINASISDVSRVYEDQAEHVAEEALRKEYESLGKIKLLSPSTYHMMGRMKLYFFREDKKNKIKKAELEKTQTNGVDMHRGELTAAADRHERMFNDDEWNNQKNENDRIDWLVQKVNDPRIDDLCKEYLNSPSGMSDRDFEDRFNALIATNEVIPDVFKDNKMKHTASNILLKLRAERGYKTMMEGILHSLEVYASNSDNTAYQTSVKNYVTTYVNLTQRAISPNLQKALTAPGAQVEKYRRYLRHEIGMAKMQANTLKIKLDVLTGGKGAYEVNNRDKNTNLFAWLGRRLDNNPKTALALSIGTTITAGILAGPALASAVAIGKGVTWLVSKKAAHYTKEQEGQEKKLVRGLDNEKNKLSNLKGFLRKASFFQKAKNYKAFRQGRLYANTTQFEFMNDAKKDLENIRTQMLTLQKPELRKSIADALARIDYYVTSGHNFFGQQNDKEMEETMNDLQKIVESGAETLGTTKEAMRQDPIYTQVRGELDSEYKTLRGKFKTQRTRLGVKYGIAAAVAGLGLRHVLGNDVNKHSFGGSDGGATTVPPHTPDDPPIQYVPTQTPPNIYDANFDVDHHDLYDANTYGMLPSEIYEHCSHINVLDPTISKNVVDHMVATNELLPTDKANMLSAVDKMINSHIPPSPYLEDKVAKYLYHFAERDPFIGKIIGGGGEAIKDVINDGGAGQKGWLDAFLGGGETLARYLANIASVASPLYANTFLGNPKVPTLDKNGKKPGDIGYIPTFNNTIVDPNKKPVPGGFENEDPLNWIIRKGSTNTLPTTPTNVVTPVQPIPVTPVALNVPQVVTPVTPTQTTNTVVPSQDDTALQIQQELEEAQAKQFVDELTPAIQPLHDRYNTYVKDVYQNILADFDAAKNETDLAKKISALQTLQGSSQTLKNSIQIVKNNADNKYDDFKKKYDALSPAVQNKVKVKLSDLQQFRRKTQSTIQELGVFIQTLTEAIANVGTGTTPAPVAPVVTPAPVNPTGTNTSPAPVANSTTTVTKTPAKKNQPAVKVQVPAPVKPTTTVKPNIQQPKPSVPVVKSQPKVLDVIRDIKIPDQKLSKVNYHNEMEKGYNQYLNVILFLEGIQRDLRRDINYAMSRIDKGIKINQQKIDIIIANRNYLNQRADAFVDSFEAYYKATGTQINDTDSLFDKVKEISNRNDRFDDYNKSFEAMLEDMIEKNKKNTGSLQYNNSKILDVIRDIKIPDQQLSKVDYQKAIEDGYNQYLDIVKFLKSKQSSVLKSLQFVNSQLNNRNMVEEKLIDKSVNDRTYLIDRVYSFEQSFKQYYAATTNKIDSGSPLRDKIKVITDMYSDIVDVETKCTDIVQNIEKYKNTPFIVPASNKQQSSSVPAGTTVQTTTTTTVTNNQAPVAAPVVVNTTVVVPTITDDSILAEFNALKGNKTLRILKKDSPEIFSQYKAILDKNPDMYNYVASKKEIAINGILDKNTWVGQAK